MSDVFRRLTSHAHYGERLIFSHLRLLNQSNITKCWYAHFRQKGSQFSNVMHGPRGSRCTASCVNTCSNADLIIQLLHRYASDNNQIENIIRLSYSVYGVGDKRNKHWSDDVSRRSSSYDLASFFTASLAHIPRKRMSNSRIERSYDRRWYPIAARGLDSRAIYKHQQRSALGNVTSEFLFESLSHHRWPSKAAETVSIAHQNFVTRNVIINVSELSSSDWHFATES